MRLDVTAGRESMAKASRSSLAAHAAGGEPQADEKPFD